MFYLFRLINKKEKVYPSRTINSIQVNLKNEKKEYQGRYFYLP